MITLCEECFPLWKYVEVLAQAGLVGNCGSCGKEDTSVHCFPSDPREAFVKIGDNAWKVKKGVLK